MHLAASVRIVGTGPGGDRPLDPVLQRRAATSVPGLCGTPSTPGISGVGCAETRGSLHIGFVDTHAKGNGGDNTGHMAGHEVTLDILTPLAVEPGVVSGSGEPCFV